MVLSRCSIDFTGGLRPSGARHFRILQAADVTSESTSYRHGRWERPGGIRKAREDDMPWIALTIASMIMSPLGLSTPNFLVAEAEEETIGKVRLGFAQLRSLESEDAGPFLLASLFVEPEARGQGVATGLVKELLARRERCSTPRSPVYALTLKNKLGFFERLQFRELGETEDLPDALALEAQLGRWIAPLAAGEPLIVLRNDG
eukprot:symbB.v1.2.016406.t1/scaffold1217.1/size131114/7